MSYQHKMLYSACQQACGFRSKGIKPFYTTLTALLMEQDLIVRIRSARGYPVSRLTPRKYVSVTIVVSKGVDEVTLNQRWYADNLEILRDETYTEPLEKPYFYSSGTDPHEYLGENEDY